MKDVLSLTTFAIGALCFVVFVTTVSRMLSVRSRRRASTGIAKCRLWCVNRRGVPTPARSGRRPTPKSINANSCHLILAAHVHCRFASVMSCVWRWCFWNRRSQAFALTRPYTLDGERKCDPRKVEIKGARRITILICRSQAMRITNLTIDILLITGVRNADNAHA
jgi:hypothetical protein